MAIPPLTDAQIESDQPFDEALAKDGLRDRDVYLWDGADNGGTGIAGNVQAFLGTGGAFSSAGHSHDGTDGQGANIDTAGIAANAASDEAMFTDNAATSGKFAANTLQTGDFATGACTTAKMSGTMGTNVTSGPNAYDTALPPIGDSVVFLGDRVKVGAPKTGVALRFKPTASTYGGGSNRVDCWVVRYEGGDVVLGFDYVAGQHDAAGTWSADFYIV